MMAASAAQVRMATSAYWSGPSFFNSFCTAARAPASDDERGHAGDMTATVMPTTMPGSIVRKAATPTDWLVILRASSALEIMVRWTMCGFKGNAKKLKTNQKNFGLPDPPKLSITAGMHPYA